MQFSLRRLFVAMAWIAVALAMSAPLFTLHIPREPGTTWDEVWGVSRIMAFFFAGIPLAFGVTVLTRQPRIWIWALPILWPIIGTALLILFRAPLTLP